MAKFSLGKLPKQQRIQLIGEFYDVVASLKSREEVRAFFRDLLNPNEIAMLMRRVEIAALLCGGFTYEEIGKLTGVGKGTINAVQKKLLREEKVGGYRKVVERLLEQRKKNIQYQQKKQRLRESSFGQLKKDYPLHFLFFNILDEIALRQERKTAKLTKKAYLRTPSRRSNIID